MFHLQALQVLFGDPSFPVVVMLSIDSEQVIKSLNKAGIESGQKYLNQLLNMRFCVPDSSTHDIGIYLILYFTKTHIVIVTQGFLPSLCY